MEDVNFDEQVYAKHDILLESEFLPDVLQKWIDNNPSSLLLFTRLITSSDPYIAVRQALLDNVTYSDVVCFADADHKGDIDYTINWAIEKKLTYKFMSERYYTMMAIIENCLQTIQLCHSLDIQVTWLPWRMSLKHQNLFLCLKGIKIEALSFLVILGQGSNFRKGLMVVRSWQSS